MPFVSRKQQRYLESSSSPLSESQKREWESATNFKTLPEKVKASGTKKSTKYTPSNHWSGK